MHFTHIFVTGPILYVAPSPGETLSLTEILFPGVSSSLPQHNFLNITFDCNANQLDLHIEISEGAEFIPEVLSFSNLVLSLRVTIDTPPSFNSIILSANTQLFSIATFVAVKYNFARRKITIKGIPTDTNSLSIENALQAVSGTSLPVPSSMSTLSEVTFNGRDENGVITIAIEGKSNENTVSVIFQKSGPNVSAALIADIHNFNLASFVNTALSVDITGIPIFGTLTIPELGFAAATRDITSDLLPMLYVPGSPLEEFGTTLPRGVSAYFTVDVAGVRVNAAFSLNKLSFNVPSTSSLSVKHLLDQVPNLSVVNSLPNVLADVLNSQLSGFNFDPQTKQLDFGLILPELTVIPNMLKLTNVNFMLSAMIGSNPSIQSLQFMGTWKFSTVSLTTSIDYDGEINVFKVKASPESSDTSLSIDTLLKSVAGVNVNLPSALTSLSLTSIVGNVYNNGNYFIAMSGSVSGGKLYLVFYKGTEGVKVGIAASLESFQFSKLVLSTVGADITGVPYFGDLVIPAMALAITSGEIKSPALSHLFGEKSPLLAYGDTLPAGVTSRFDLDIGAVKGAFAEFYNGMLAFQLPESVDFSLQNLASEIPGINDALQALPPQITSILSAKISSFAFNSTSKDLTIMAALNTLTLVSGFLSLSDISLYYDGRLDKTLTTRTLDFTGTWQIGDYAILTSVLYDGASKDLTIASQSNGGKNLSISNVVQSLAGTTVQLPAAISSFTFTGITGKLTDDIIVVILNGMIGSGKISAIFQKTSSESDGAVVVDIANFQLVELVKSATGIDISGIPFFGTLEIPELKFAAATDNITTPLLEELAGSGTALEWFKTGIIKGISGRFVIQIGDTSKIAVNFAGHELDFKVPDTSSLSLNDVISILPDTRDILNSLPSQLSSVFDSQIVMFYYDPLSTELQFSGSLDSTVDLVPGFLSLNNVKISLIIVLGDEKRVESLDFSGDWNLKNLAIHTTVSYNRAENRLDIVGELDEANSGVSVPELITSLSGESLSIPSVLSSVKLSKLSGNKIDDVTLVTLSGSVSEGHIFIIYQKSSSGSAVAFAADTTKFRLSSLVSSATGIDISSVPFFGTLIIPQIGFTVSSARISNPLLLDLYPPTSPLAEFGSSIDEGVTASFNVSVGDVEGIVADFAKGELDLEVPDSVDLSLIGILELIPGLQGMIDSLPQTIQDIGSTKLHKLYFVPTTNELQVRGSLDSLAIIPDFLSLQNIDFEFAGTIAINYSVEFVKFKGDWIINSLGLTTEVFYEINLLLISGAPTEDSSSLPLPSVLSSLNLNRVVATSSNEITTVVLTATAGAANVYVLYQKTPSASAIAIAAEIHTFKIVNLIETATGIDLSGTPFISSFVVSTMAFTAATNPITTPLLADTFNPDGPLQVYGDTLPKGVTAEFEVQIGGKTGIKVTYRDGQLKFVVPSKISLSLNDLLSQIPDIASVVRDLPSPISDLLSTSLQALDFDATTKTLSVAASLDQLIIIPQIMEVKDLEVEFVTILSSNNGGLQSLDFSADWVLGDSTIRIKVMYDKDSGQVFFAAMPKGGLSIQQLVSGLTGFDIPLPVAINSVQLTKIVGRKTPSMFTMIFSGTIANRADVHLVYQNMVSSSHIAIAAGIQSFTISELIDSAVNIDISNVPFFGTFSVPFLALSVARGQIITDLLAEVIPANSPLIKYGNTIPDGFTAQFDAPIGSINGIIGSYSDSVLTFTVPPDVDASLGSLISVIPDIDANSIGIGSLFKDILSIQIRSFTFNAPKKEMDIEMYLEKITFFEDILTIKDAHLKLSASFSNSISVDAEASGIIALGDMDYAVSIGRDAATNKYAVIIETDNLPIFGLVTAISATFLPDDLQLFLESALQFNIRDAKVVYPFGVEPQQIQLSGTPEIFGQNTVHMTAVAIRYGGKMRLISKYDFGRFNIADLIKKLVGVSLHSLKILDQTVDINFVLSPQSIKGVSLSIPEFEGYSLDQGISIRAPLDWPSDCSSDAFCNVAYNLLGDVQLSLKGTIANARSFSLTATIGDLKLGGGVVLLRAGLQFVAGTNPSVGVVGSIELSDPEITLTAAIRATVSGVKLEGSMSGCWYNAFGSSYLTLCNLFLAMTIIPSPVPISGLEFGGRVELGKQSCGRLVTAEAYVGINIINPNQNYFYADVGPVTLMHSVLM